MRNELRREQFERENSIQFGKLYELDFYDLRILKL